MMNDNKALERTAAIAAALRCCGSSPKVDRCKDECMFYRGGYMGKCIPAMTEAAAALIEQLTAEPPNDPLTLEELRGMDGEPVWIVEHPDWGHWELSECAEDYFDDRDPDFYGMTMPPTLPDPMGRYGLHVLGWLAYRRKPDGGGE